MPTAIIYARVSTEDQLERYGLPTQIRACQDHAAKLGLTVSQVITDDGISGTILDRPGLSLVRQMVRERKADAVVMLDVDRLSRELAHLLILKPEIERMAQLHFVAAKFEATPSGNMFFGIRGVIAQYERALTRERTMRGRSERARSGLIVGGRVAYGYTYQAGALVEDPERAQVVRSIFGAHEAGMSIRGIATQLRASGAPTWGGGKWGKSSVARILQNETYAGIAHYGTHQREGTLVRVRQGGERIPVAVPALVSHDCWQRVQARLSANPSVGRPSSAYLLRGVLFCANCGKKMCGETSRRNLAYRCSGRDRLRHEGAPCRNTASVPTLDASVWQALSRTFTSAAALRELLKQHEAALKATDPSVSEDLQKRLAKLRRREESCLVNLADPDLAMERGRFKVELRELREDIRKAESDLLALQRRPIAGDWIEEFVLTVTPFVRGMTDPKRKQEFVRRLVRRAEWDGENLNMYCPLVPKLATTSARSGQLTDSVEVVVTARVAA